MSRARTLLSAVGITALLLAAGFASRDERDPFAAPAAGPERRLFDVLKRVVARISEDRVTSIAAGVAFFALLAIFPAIGALVSIYGLFSDPAALRSQLDTLAAVLPGGALDVIGGELARVVAQPRAALGTSFLFGLALSLWSANAGTKALMDALNIVYDETETRGFLQLNAVSLAFTLGGIVLVLLLMAAVVVLPVALGHVGLGGEAELLVKVARWPALFISIALALAVTYRFGPSRGHAGWRWITWGSASASLLWLAASMLFSWYAENFGSYNKTYGTLGAVIGFMTWLWLSNIVILAGAELDAELACRDPSMPRRSGCGFAGSEGLRGAAERAAETGR